MEDDLQDEIAELVTERVGVTGVDRFERLVGLLEQVARERSVRLLPVPRAPSGARSFAMTSTTSAKNASADGRRTPLRPSESN